MVKFECKAGRILFSKLHSSTILQGARNEPLTTGAYLFPIHGAWSIYGLVNQTFFVAERLTIGDYKRPATKKDLVHETIHGIDSSYS